MFGIPYLVVLDNPIIALWSVIWGNLSLITS